MKNMKELIKAINAVASSNKGDITVSVECEKALASLDKDSINYRIVKKVSKDDKTMAKKDDDLGDISYSRTKQVLAEWAQIRDKYLPESDRWKQDTIQKIEDPYENEERQEERRKFDHYLKRSNDNFWTLIPLA